MEDMMLVVVVMMVPMVVHMVVPAAMHAFAVPHPMAHHVMRHTAGGPTAIRGSPHIIAHGLSSPRMLEPDPIHIM